MTDTTASTPARAGGGSWLGRLEGSLSWILLGLVGLLLPLLDDSYIGTIAQRAYIYWILSAGLNLVVGYAGQIATGWVSMLTLGAYNTAAQAASTSTYGTAAPQRGAVRTGTAAASPSIIPAGPPGRRIVPAAPAAVRR